jgi:hypothetical protein
MAERLKDVQRKGTTANGESAATLGEDANLLMLIQVPLRQKEVARMAGVGAGGQVAYDMLESAPPLSPSSTTTAAKGSTRGVSDVDVAVLGHGETEGPYTELDGLEVERDPRFPVRVTVQFYQATSNGVVSPADVARMAAQIEKVYAKGDYVGSLVVPAPADRRRPTNHDGAIRHDDGTYSFPGIAERYRRYGVMWVPVNRQPIKVK